MAEQLVEIEGHTIDYRAHRYECTRCGARLLSIMQFQSRECPGPREVAPTAAPESTPTEREAGDVGEVAAVLAAHEADVTSYDAGDIHGCECGWELTSEQRRYDFDKWGAYRAHVAEVIEALIAERERVAGARALREAANALDTTDHATETALSGVDHVISWLRDRAIRTALAGDA